MGTSGDHGAGSHGDHETASDRRTRTSDLPDQWERKRQRGQVPQQCDSRAFARWQQMIDTGIEYYVKGLDGVLSHPLLTVGVAFGLLAGTLVVMWPIMRRDFFPEVDAGAFEMYVRAESGMRIEKTEKRIKAVEDFVRKTIEKEDLHLILSEIGVTSDWSAAYTLNAGPMDAVVKIQFTEERSKSAQEYVHILRTAFARRHRFQRPRICIRRRRHGSLGHERRPIDADFHSRDREGPEGCSTRSPRRSRSKSRRSTALSTRGSFKG